MQQSGALCYADKVLGYEVAFVDERGIDFSYANEPTVFACSLLHVQSSGYGMR